MLKDCDPFTKCIMRINSTQVDYASYTDLVMPIYNLIRYSEW